MKQTKKLFSIVLAIALVFAMAIPAFAAETQTGTIKINGVEGYPVADRTFEAYKILDAVAVNPANPGAGVLYSVPAAMAGFYADYFESVGDDEAIDDVVAAINALKDDTDALQAFAQAALEFADGKVEPVASTKTGDEVAIKNAPFGYYLINDVTVVGKDRVGIIAAVCTDLAAFNVNVLDISQTVMQGYFTMMMVVDVANSTYPVAELAQKLEEKGKEMGLSIRLQREEIFQAMHRI